MFKTLIVGKRRSALNLTDMTRIRHRYSCRVRFDYWLAEDCDNAESIAESLACSDQVQQEDIEICENVQVGLSSSGYVPGRYAPRLERGDHAFHRQLYTEYTSVP